MSSDKAFAKRECVFSTVLATEILNKDTDMKKYLNLQLKKLSRNTNTFKVNGLKTFLLDFL